MELVRSATHRLSVKVGDQLHIGHELRRRAARSVETHRVALVGGGSGRGSRAEPAESPREVSDHGILFSKAYPDARNVQISPTGESAAVFAYPLRSHGLELVPHFHHPVCGIHFALNFLSTQNRMLVLHIMLMCG